MSWITLNTAVQQRDGELAGLKQQAQTEQAQLTQTLRQQEEAAQGLRQQVEQLSSSLERKERQLEEAATEKEATRRDYRPSNWLLQLRSGRLLSGRETQPSSSWGLWKEKVAKLEVLQAAADGP